MPRFNSKAATTKTTNLAGGQAYRETAKLELASILLTSFVQDQYYRSANDTLDRVRELIAALPDKRFAAKAAIYARTTYGMRSISHVVAGEIAHQVKGETWTRPFFDRVVHRVDDASEILSYYAATYGKPLPNSLKDGLGRALGRFDSYALAKYRGENRDLKLVDVVNLTHPKPTDKSAEGLKALVEGTLRSTDTWEAKLTQAGQQAETEEEKAELKGAAWAELITTRKLGYFALLRNLRNILEQAPEVIDEALAMLTDETLIRKSLVLPFRYTTAIEQLQQVSSVPTDAVRKTIIALSKAVDLSLKNVPTFDGKTLIAVDVSGSMHGKPIQIAALFAACLYKASNAMLLLFDGSARYAMLNPTDSTLSLAEQIERLATGGSTNFHAIFQATTQPFDRIIVLSDMQGWVEHTYGWSMARSLADYTRRTGANPHLYSFDLAGYGTLQLPQDRVYCLAGFSEKTLELMQMLEQDKNALVNAIEAVEL